MGAVHVKTVNDRLLQTDYTDPEQIKTILSNWSMMEKLAQKGDSVACAILVDLERAIGISISDFGASKKAGLDVAAIERSCLTEAQYISIVYVLGLGYRQDEVAFILGCTKQTVNIHIARGLKRICRFLEGKCNEDKKKRGRSGRSMAQRKRSVLHGHEQRKGKKDRKTLPNSGSRGIKVQKGDPN